METILFGGFLSIIVQIFGAAIGAIGGVEFVKKIKDIFKTEDDLDFPEEYKEHVDTEMMSQINSVVEENNLEYAKSFDLLDRARKTQQWIDYTKYYIINKDNGAALLPADEETKMFVNAIANHAGYFGEIYEDVGSADLNKYDIENDNYDIENEKFIINIDSLDKCLRRHNLQTKIKEHNMEGYNKYHDMTAANPCIETNETNPVGVGRIDENGMIHPTFTVKEDDVFFFDKNTGAINDKDKQSNLPDELFRKLEKKFASILNGEQYWYSINKYGMIELSVVHNYCVEKFYIDNGRIMGGDDIFILANYNNSQDTIFVSVTKHPYIVINIIKTAFYNLTPQEVAEVSSDYFDNTIIYRYIDFSNTNWIDHLSDDEKSILEKKLFMVVNDAIRTNRKISNPYNDITPRYRFNNFKSLDDFEIVSDEKVVSPLANIGITSSIINKSSYYKIVGPKVMRKTIV